MNTDASRINNKHSIVIIGSDRVFRYPEVPRKSQIISSLLPIDYSFIEPEILLSESLAK